MAAFSWPSLASLASFGSAFSIVRSANRMSLSSWTNRFLRVGHGHCGSSLNRGAQVVPGERELNLSEEAASSRRAPHARGRADGNRRSPSAAAVSRRAEAQSDHAPLRYCADPAAGRRPEGLPRHGLPGTPRVQGQSSRRSASNRKLRTVAQSLHVMRTSNADWVVHRRAAIRSCPATTRSVRRSRRPAGADKRRRWRVGQGHSVLSSACTRGRPEVAARLNRCWPSASRWRRL